MNFLENSAKDTTMTLSGSINGWHNQILLQNPRKMFLPEMHLPNWVLLPSWTVEQLELPLLLLFPLSLFPPVSPLCTIHHFKTVHSFLFHHYSTTFSKLTPWGCNKTLCCSGDWWRTSKRGHWVVWREAWLVFRCVLFSILLTRCCDDIVGCYLSSGRASFVRIPSWTPGHSR